MDFVILGHTLTSTRGGVPAIALRTLTSGLLRRGHSVVFLEWDAPWFARQRDLPEPEGCEVFLWADLAELRERYAVLVSSADVLMICGGLPNEAELNAWALPLATGRKLYYDLGLPPAAPEAEALSVEIRSAFDIRYLLTQVPMPGLPEANGSPMRPLEKDLLPSVDASMLYPEPTRLHRAWDLAYRGTAASAYLRRLEHLLCDPARQWPEGRFLMAASPLPAEAAWPPNLRTVEGLDANGLRNFYNSQRFFLHLAPPQVAGYVAAPSLALLEAAACGIPALSEHWPGLEAFFLPGTEVLPVNSAEDVLQRLRRMRESDRRELGERARERVLREHTCEQRAAQLETDLAAFQVEWKKTEDVRSKM